MPIGNDAHSAPPTERDLVKEAIRLYEAGRREDAARLARERVRAEPTDAEAYHVLGVCYTDMGHSVVAVGVLERALALDPERARCRVSLAVALRAVGDTAGASRELAAARALSPQSPYARLESGVLSLCTGEAGEALEHFLKVLREDPAAGRARVGAALAQAQLGRTAQARVTLDEADSSQSGSGIDLLRLANELEAQGRFEDALTVMRLGLTAGIDDPELAYRVAAADGCGSVTRAPDDYVEAHFDRFADSFDEVLRGRLRYETPELIVAAAERHLPAKTIASALDGGCGTGLCGPLLRPLAQRLVGVDLSGAMLEKARRLGCYDELLQENLVPALCRQRATFDLIVCADVLVYFGELGDFFRGARRSLRAGGVLAISFERAEDEEGYLLQRSGRFAHGEGYVRGVAAAAGLEQRETARCDLRVERSVAVPGVVAVYRAR